MRSDLYQELSWVEDNHWWHIHKRKIVKELIGKYGKGKRVLDIGAGTGKLLAELKESGFQVWGVDSDQRAIKWSKKRNIKILKVDLSKDKLPFKKNHFDLVIGLDILEHLKEPEKILGEIKRVLAQKGKIIVTVPAYLSLFSYWDRMLGHERRYSKKMLSDLFIKGGFKIRWISFFNIFILLPSILVRLFKSKTNQVEESDFKIGEGKSLITRGLNVLNLLERLWLKKFSLPFGLSLVIVGEK